MRPQSSDTSTPAHASTDPRANAMRLAARKRAAVQRRTRRIRSAIAAVSVSLFIAAFSVVYIQLASGHDPALTAAARRSQSSGLSTRSSGGSSTVGTSTSSTSDAPASTASGEGSSSTSGERSSSTSGERSSSGEEASRESSSGSSTSAVTTSQS